MSFVCSNETLSIITDYIYFFRTWNTPGFTLRTIYPFEDGSKKTIFRELSELNMKAWADSAKGHEPPIAVLEERPSYSPSMINFKENFVSQYMVVKALDCYLYQCYGTDDVEGAPILDYLDDLERSLALYIVKRNKYFDLLMWG